MSRTIDWEDQRAFLAVLEEGSLSGAARRMGVAQPTLRSRIGRLEHTLGVVLFTRSVHGLVPTAQARGLGEAAWAMARASEAFVRVAAAGPDEVAGVVRVGVSEFVGLEVLPAMLVPLRARYPALAIEIEISNASANLLEQQVDLAVRMYPPRQEALVARKVSSIQLGFFAHVDYLAARGTPRTIADLAHHDLIGPDRSVAYLDMIDTMFPDIDRRRFVVRTDSHPAMLAAARVGLGLAMVQKPVGARDANLRAVLEDVPMPSLGTWVVTHENLRDQPRVRAVFDHLVTAFEAYQVQ